MNNKILIVNVNADSNLVENTIKKDAFLIQYKDNFEIKDLDAFIALNNDDIINYNYVYVHGRVDRDNIDTYHTKIQALKALNYNNILTYEISLVDESIKKENNLYGKCIANAAVESLNNANLIVPRYMSINKNTSSTDITTTLNLPVMLKTVYGSLGENLYMCDTVEKLESKLSIIKEGNVDYFAQEYVESDRTTECWIVYNGRIIDAVRKHGNIEDSEYRSHIKYGGTAEKIESSTDDQNIAAEFTKIFKTPFCGGLDIIRKDDKYYFLEMNNHPTNDIIEITKHNHIADILTDILNQIINK